MWHQHKQPWVGLCFKGLLKYTPSPSYTSGSARHITNQAVCVGAALAPVECERIFITCWFKLLNYNKSCYTISGFSCVLKLSKWEFTLVWHLGSYGEDLEFNLQDLIYKACWLLCRSQSFSECSFHLGTWRSSLLLWRNHSFTFTFARIWWSGTFLFTL